MSDIQFNMIEEQLDPTIITEAVINMSIEWMAKENLYPTESQKKALKSHINSMVLRAKKIGNPLPDVDADLFDEISESSMKLAKRVVNVLVGLPIEEAYLLSVHFEVAKSKS